MGVSHRNRGWRGDTNFHYATPAGDACHRAQPWFDESQVPKPRAKDGNNVEFKLAQTVVKNNNAIGNTYEIVELDYENNSATLNNGEVWSLSNLSVSIPKKVYPSSESEWPKKPSPPEGYEWVRLEKSKKFEKGDIYLSFSNTWRCVQSGHCADNPVIFRAQPIENEHEHLPKKTIIEQKLDIMIEALTDIRASL